jgi:hypothetical protein
MHEQFLIRVFAAKRFALKKFLPDIVEIFWFVLVIAGMEDRTL